MSMSIRDIANKCKDSILILERRDFFIALLIIFASFASFGLGRLSALQEKKTPIRIEQSIAQSAAVANSVSSDGQTTETNKAPATEKALSSGGSFVGSKSGTTYHFPWCPGASRIKDENKIWFQTKEAAEKAGYHPAGNCKGL